MLAAHPWLGRSSGGTRGTPGGWAGRQVLSMQTLPRAVARDGLDWLTGETRGPLRAFVPGLSARELPPSPLGLTLVSLPLFLPSWAVLKGLRHVPPSLSKLPERVPDTAQGIPTLGCRGRGPSRPWVPSSCSVSFLLPLLAPMERRGGGASVASQHSEFEPCTGCAGRPALSLSPQSSLGSWVGSCWPPAAVGGWQGRHRNE